MAKPRTYRLPWPVGTNQLWRSVKGRNILSKAARKWFEAAGEELMLQRPEAVKGPVEIRIALMPPTKRRYDPDGRIKSTLDALVRNHIIEDDDNTIIHKLTVDHTKAEEGLSPGALVTVLPLTDREHTEKRAAA